MSGKVRMTWGSGNVFRDMGFSKAEAENLRLRSELMRRIDALVNVASSAGMNVRLVVKKAA